MGTDAMYVQPRTVGARSRLRRELEPSNVVFIVFSATTMAASEDHEPHVREDGRDDEVMLRISILDDMRGSRNEESPTDPNARTGTGFVDDDIPGLSRRLWCGRHDCDRVLRSFIVKEAQSAREQKVAFVHLTHFLG